MYLKGLFSESWIYFKNLKKKVACLYPEHKQYETIPRFYAQRTDLAPIFGDRKQNLLSEKKGIRLRKKFGSDNATCC